MESTSEEALCAPIYIVKLDGFNYRRRRHASRSSLVRHCRRQSPISLSSQVYSSAANLALSDSQPRFSGRRVRRVFFDSDSIQRGKSISFALFRRSAIGITTMIRLGQITLRGALHALPAACMVHANACNAYKPKNQVTKLII